MNSQVETDRICEEANRLEQLARDLCIGQEYFEDRELLAEIQSAVEMLRRYVCGGLVMEFASAVHDRDHKYILQREIQLVTTV